MSFLYRFDWFGREIFAFSKALLAGTNPRICVGLAIAIYSHREPGR